MHPSFLISPSISSTLFSLPWLNALITCFDLNQHTQSFQGKIFISERKRLQKSPVYLRKSRADHYLPLKPQNHTFRTAVEPAARSSPQIAHHAAFQQSLCCIWSWCWLVISWEAAISVKKVTFTGSLGMALRATFHIRQLRSSRNDFSTFSGFNWNRTGRTQVRSGWALRFVFYSVSLSPSLEGVSFI